MIPIIILHHNDLDSLKKCITSIKKETKTEYKLYIVDNNSEKEIQKQIKILFKKKNCTIIYNPKDNWLLGFNLAIKKIRYNWDYIILSDADIIFRKTKKNVCWLKHLINELNLNPSIGKLGIRLNTRYIKNKKKFIEIYKRELTYQKGKKIGNNVIAPTDTTAAIYRKNLFITNKFEMQIGHTNLIKPYYYSCRTSKILECDHIGWCTYNKFFLGKNLNLKELRKKAWFFCKMNRPIEMSLSCKLPLYERIILFILSRLFYRTIYSIKFNLNWVCYLIKNFPFNYNEIQNRVNK
jgi:hypothetical protein